ncbi:D-alanyl-D-alanine carboxypeptidase/D-alanyl-D-alanine-endopeptidase [soil metagenome]
MKIKTYQLKIAAILAFAIAAFGLYDGISVAAQQNTQRQRITGTPTPSPTPAIPNPIATSTPLVGQSLADLQGKIRFALSRAELQRGQVGVKIVSLDTNKTIFEQNPEKYFMPASNMKSYTMAAAIERLSPSFRFVTSVSATSPVDASGTIKGNLTITGSGDVSFSPAFYDGDYYKGLDALAEKIVQAGVKRIEGDLVGDDSYFLGNATPFGWEWDDMQWYYGAEISALNINNNSVDLSVKPSAVGAPCIVQILPLNSVVKIQNTCTTSANSVKRDLKATKKLDQNILEISGSMPANDKIYQGSIAISRPAEMFVELLRQVLLKKGVVVTGQNRVIGAKENSVRQGGSSLLSIAITKIESPPLSVIAAKTMKPSQNLYTETILWTLGEQVGDKTNPKSTSAERGLDVVKNFLGQIGVATDSVLQYDGSGLSRHNLITPNSAVQLYTYMAKQSRYAQVWQDALTIGGVDGTLRNRFKGTKAAGNVRGKTGTIDQVSALSGYVSTVAGEKLVFSIIVNGVAENGIRQATIDEIVVALANFSGSLK